MDGELEPPLDVGEFKCTAASPAGVVVVFEPTNRRYSYGWHNGELAIAAPAIEGVCGPHPAEVIDCLARAVAYHAALAVAPPFSPAQIPASRTLTSQLRSFLSRGYAPTPGGCR